MWSWLQFFVSTVLPVAGRELLHWLYEWQVLVAGILAILAARIWGRSVVRAARYAALSAGTEPAVAQRSAAAAVVPFGSAKPKARKPEMQDHVESMIGVYDMLYNPDQRYALFAPSPTPPSRCV